MTKAQFGMPVNLNSDRNQIIRQCNVRYSVRCSTFPVNNDDEIAHDPQCVIKINQVNEMPMIDIALIGIDSTTDINLSACRLERNPNTPLYSTVTFIPGIKVLECEKITKIYFLKDEFAFDENCNYNLDIETFNIDDFKTALFNRIRRFKEISDTIQLSYYTQTSIDLSSLYKTRH